MRSCCPLHQALWFLPPFACKKPQSLGMKIYPGQFNTKHRYPPVPCTCYHYTVMTSIPKESKSFSLIDWYSDDRSRQHLFLLVCSLFLFSFLIFLFQLIRLASTYFALTQLEKQQTLAAILQGFAAIHSYCSHILRAHLGYIKLPPSYPVWHYTDDFSCSQPDGRYLLNANIKGARLQKISHCTNLHLGFPVWEQEEHLRSDAYHGILKLPQTQKQCEFQGCSDHCLL